MHLLKNCKESNMEQTAIKTASKLLQKIHNNDNNAEAMTFVGIVLTMEANNETEFFLSQLDDVIAFCNKLKVCIVEESKPIILK
jgi:hypothetical protein